MRRAFVFWALFGGWAVLSLLSVAGPMTTAAAGDGFIRGLNRVSLFLMYQTGAAALAAILLATAPAQPTGLRRWLGRTPALVVVTQLLALGAVILWGRLTAGTA